MSTDSSEPKQYTFADGDLPDDGEFFTAIGISPEFEEHILEACEVFVKNFGLQNSDNIVLSKALQALMNAVQPKTEIEYVYTGIMFRRSIEFIESEVRRAATRELLRNAAVAFGLHSDDSDKPTA